MTSEGLGEMFEGDFAVTGADKFLLMSMGSKNPNRDEQKFSVGFLNPFEFC